MHPAEQQAPDYTFRTVNAEQRHLAPGMYAALFADDAFSPDIRSELILTRVLNCFDDGDYMGRVVSPAQHFPELTQDEVVTFRLDQVVKGSQRHLYCLEA